MKSDIEQKDEIGVVECDVYIYIIYSKRWRGTICDMEWWNANYHLYFCVVF